MRPFALVVLLALALSVPGHVARAAPEHVHLGLPDADGAHARSVVWWEPAARGDAKVVLETPAGAREFPATSVDGPAIGFVYEARLTDLAPATTYAYAIDDRKFTLTTPPETLDGGASFTFVAIGDMGIREQSRVTRDAIQALQPAFVLHAGDISYAEGRQNEWHEWFRMVEPVAAHAPWVTALGNHETYFPHGLANFISREPASSEIAYYKQVFSLPGNEVWYSFDWAGVHFVSLDTFSTRDAPTEEQLAWLREDLAANANAVWTIAFLHEPPYSSNDAHGSNEALQKQLSPVLEAGGVDLVIAGHDHAYERTFPIRDGQPTLRSAPLTREGAGTVYLVTGGGGQSVYREWQDPPPTWSAARAAIYHAVAFTVDADRIAGRVVPTAGDAFEDAFVISKTQGATPDGTPAAIGEGGAGTPTPGLPAVVIAVALAGLLARVRRGRPPNR